MTAIRKHLVDFVAVVALCIVALIVGGYILSHQRFHFPAWVPVIGQDYYELKGEFSTAQAVTPGQGQTVNVAGVQVGEISKVELKDGRAVVTMRLKRKYDRVYRDARMLLRPKTGLRDMIVELTPGTRRAGRVPDGGTIPVSNTLPDVNADEVLAALDRDTRDYLKLLLGAGGEGLRGEGRNLSATLRRFEPTARDVQRITGKLGERRRNLSRLIHNMQLLTTELGTKDDDIAALVASSNAVFQAFANQDAKLRETLRQLPSTLQQTSTTLDKTDTFARQLGPTLQSLRPAARALGPALQRTRPFLRQTTPIVRDELRPFARDALPTVRILRPTAANLAALAPKFTTTARVVNYLLNTLAYNPPGTEEGYLFWTSWANHAGNAVFSTQDAHGPIRHGLFIASCSTLQLLTQVADTNPNLKVLVDLLRAPRQSDVCPESTAPPSTASPAARSSAPPAAIQKAPPAPATAQAPGQVGG